LPEISQKLRKTSGGFGTFMELDPKILFSEEKMNLKKYF
jgi:hypothetical protein